MTVTSAPASTSHRVTWRPMNPLPPITATRTFLDPTEAAHRPSRRYLLPHFPHMKEERQREGHADREYGGPRQPRPRNPDPASLHPHEDPDDYRRDDHVETEEGDDDGCVAPGSGVSNILNDRP